ncbi:Peptidyl-prolyl cis-trans isomerase [Planctomycetales bacterium 10988]|nr:Peptidyl-prolyl cis-trans isomerase [Planctomycetales bacterium 10988]
MKMQNLGTIVAVATVFALLLGSRGHAQQPQQFELPTPGQGQAQQPIDMKKVSYLIGYDFGQTLASQQVQVDLQSYMEGFRTGIAGGNPNIPEEEINALMTQFQQMLVERQQKMMAEQANKAKAAGEAFLAQNAKQPGIQTTASGLQYQVLQPGSGATPAPEDEVQVHYEGTLINGTVFDSSYQRGEPISFPVNGVIPGWTEALQLMKEGAKWKLFIPSQLAYGERGAGQTIGPNEVLVFTVELLQVKK